MTNKDTDKRDKLLPCVVDAAVLCEGIIDTQCKARRPDPAAHIAFTCKADRLLLRGSNFDADQPDVEIPLVTPYEGCPWRSEYNPFLLFAFYRHTKETVKNIVLIPCYWDFIPIRKSNKPITGELPRHLKESDVARQGFAREMADAGTECDEYFAFNPACVSGNALMIDMWGVLRVNKN